MPVSRTTLKDLQSALEEVEQACVVLEEEIEQRRVQLEQGRREAEGLRVSIAYFDRMAAEERGSVPKAIRNGMYEILLEERRPLHYGELLKRLEERDIAVNGRDPLRLVGAHLSNDDRFKSFKAFGPGYWGLSAWPESGKPAATTQASTNPAGAGPVRTPISLADRVRERPPSRPLEPDLFGSHDDDRSDVENFRLPPSGTEDEPDF